MERLTTRALYGKREMICLFSDCDTTGEHCPHINEDNCFCLQSILKRLGGYEDLEENSLLVKLPCKIGDVVYDINHGSKIELTVIGFRFGRMSNDDEDDELFQDDEWRVECEANDGGMAASVPFSELWKKVFLTEKDAEQALKDMEGTK